MDELLSSGFRNVWGAAKFNDEMPTWRANVHSQARRAPCYQPMANGVGGSSIAYGAISHRFHPDDFRIRSNTLARYGPGALPEGTDITDWAVSYDELEPFYDEAEGLLGVSGQAGNLRGALIPGGNPFEGPRQNPYPLPPLRTSGLTELFRDQAERAGYHPFPAPAAVLSEPYHGRAACTYCSYCSAMTCHVDAKGSVLATVIPSALETGRLEIRTAARALRIVMDDRGEPVGVDYQGPEGRVLQPAGTIILASFTFENVRLLLLSRTRQFARGLGNNSGQVGRYYMTRQHPFVYGVFEGRRLNHFTGPNGQAQAVDDFNADNFDHTGLGFIRGGKIWVNSQFLPLANSGITPPQVPRWGKRYKEFLVQNYNSMTELRIMCEVLPYDGNFLDLDPDVRDSSGMPVVRITFDIYENEQRAMAYLQERAIELLRRMGATCTWRDGFFESAMSQQDVGGARMGADPARSVVNGFGELHEAPGVFVLGGATFPSLPGLNPTLTLQAMALRTGSHIAATR
jgi:gluconate 2-dehydrogenase alpha chain